MRLKRRSFLGNLPQGAEAVYLKAAAVGQNGALPVHEPVQTAEVRDQSMSRSEVEMVGIAEDDFRTQAADLLRRQRLDRGLRAHRHEDRRGRIAVRRPYLPQSCLTVRVFDDLCKFHFNRL